MLPVAGKEGAWLEPAGGRDTGLVAGVVPVFAETRRPTNPSASPEGRDPAKAA